MSQLSWDFEQDGSQLPLSQDEFEVLPQLPLSVRADHLEVYVF